MTTTPKRARKRSLSLPVILLTSAVLVGLSGPSAFAADSAAIPALSVRVAESAQAAEVADVISDQLVEHPGGVVDGNEIHYANGVTFVAAPVGVLSLGQCSSGEFCGWSSSNYTGSFFSVSGSGAKTLSGWTGLSYSNNRSGIARLFNAAGTASTCFDPGEDRSSVSGYSSPSQVNLGSATSC